MNEDITSIPLWIRISGLLGGLLWYLVTGVWELFYWSDIQASVLAVAGLMILWWITEALPMPVVALVPLVFFPLSGVMKFEEATRPYSNPVVFLFLGGFLLGLAMEKWNLHRRIALIIIRITGTRANSIILGCMFATFLLSMWVSNTATAIMMLPIAISVINMVKENYAGKGNFSRFALVMMLGLAYAANIGGMATLIGTPPNVVLSAFMLEKYNYSIDFIEWMMFATPVALIILTITFVLLVYVFYPNRMGKLSGSKNFLFDEINKLGRMSAAEKLVLFVFLFTVIRWSFKAQLDIWLPQFKMNDTGIALFSSLLLFLLPHNIKTFEPVLQWKDTVKLPWGILLLFGGGLSLAGGLEKAKLIDNLGEVVASFSSSHIIWLLIALTALSVFLSEVMSNVALVVVMVPVTSAIADSLQINPLLLCIPVTLGASCAFMLPMGTPPNALVFSSGHIHIAQMAKTGLWLNIISSILIALASYFLITFLFHIFNFYVS